MRRLSMMFMLCICIGCQPTVNVDYGGPVAGWDEATGTKGGGQFSLLTQIDKDNVRRLQAAWTYTMPDALAGTEGGAGGTVGEHAKANMEATPIIADGKMVLCMPSHVVVALDPLSGKELWTYDPKMDRKSVPSHFCRGVSIWQSDEITTGKACQRRVFFTSGDGRLIALDLDNGKPCADFGIGGEVDMKESLGPVKPGEYYQTSPPLVFKNLVLAGSAVRDGFRRDAPGGVVRAWDTKTGKLIWAFDPVGPDMTPITAADAAQGKTFTRGTPNVWSLMSADLERGLIFMPTGNAPNDHFKGPERAVDHYGSSVVAVNAENGQVVWSFQTVHHDIWDYDVTSQPVLYEHQGKIPAVAVLTKMGHIFLLDRLTGKPLFPVEERPVPATDVPGEWTSPTQPFPTLPPPALPGHISDADVADYPFLAKGCKDSFKSLRNEGVFTPPSLGGTLMPQGIAGGFNWGSGSVDPRSNTLVATILNMPYTIELVRRDGNLTAESDHAPVNWGSSPQYGVPYSFSRKPFLSAKRIPCLKSPMGSLVAYDLNTGRERWRKTIGSLNGRLPVIGSWFTLGAPVAGGNLQTASGLTFVAATADETLRAFDTATGELLWSTNLPFSAHATPMTYRLSKDAKQYLVVATGGSAAMDPKVGNTVIAFALPD